MPDFGGLDHIDVRVPSLAAVEPFYDALMPALGLPRKRYSHVDAQGEWLDVDAEHPYNTVEYFEPSSGERAAHFIGFIEDPKHPRNATRIAFRVVAPLDVAGWTARLQTCGARNIEPSDDVVAYPALFFEDPAGTRLELCARLPSGKA